MMRKLICLLVLAMTLVTVDASAQSKTTAKKPATTTAKKSTTTTAKKTTTTTAKKPASSTAKKTTTTTTAKKSTTATKSSTTTSKSGTTTKSSSSSTTTTTKPAQSRSYSRSGNSSSSSSSSEQRYSSSSSRSSSSKNFRSDFKPHYMGEIHVGDAFTDPIVVSNHVMVGTIQGLSIGKYGDVGFGVDAQINTGYPKGGDFPIMHVAPYMSVRPAFPITEKFSIGLNMNMGISIPVLNCGDGAEAQFEAEFAPSLRFKSLRFDIGAKIAGGQALPVARLGIYLSRF